jgi:hypothetical protein
MCLTAKAGLAALSAPVLSLATTGVSLSLSWTSVPGAASYRLFYAPYPYAGPDTIGSIDMGGQTALSVDLWSGAAFYVAIQAFDDEGSNSYSNIESFFLLAVDYDQAYSAVAAGTWNQSGDTFTTYFTSSTWPDGEGPLTNIALQSPVVTLTETTFEFLNENDQLMTFHRDRGQAGEIVGTWTMFEEDRDIYVLDIRSDGTVTVTGYGALFQVPCGTMTIDGNYSDWTSAYRVYADMDGPECGDSPGLDLREVYLAQDEGFIYLRFVLNGNPDPNSGYKFGDASRHIYIRWDGWEGSISYANGFGWPQPDLPASFLHVDGNQFECKFYKSDCVSFWSGLNDLGAWLDRGTETPCRDHVDMPILQFGF